MLYPPYTIPRKMPSARARPQGDVPEIVFEWGEVRILVQEGMAPPTRETIRGLIALFPTRQPTGLAITREYLLRVSYTLTHLPTGRELCAIADLPSETQTAKEWLRRCLPIASWIRESPFPTKAEAASGYAAILEALAQARAHPR